MGLDNVYVQTRIRVKDPGKLYGEDEFYGRRFFYKTSTGRILVITVPRTTGRRSLQRARSQGKPPDHHANPAHYPTLRATTRSA